MTRFLGAITSDVYDGAFGNTILLVPVNAEALQDLRNVIQCLSIGETNRVEIKLPAENGILALQLRPTTKFGDKSLVASPGHGYLWINNREGWITVVELMDALLQCGVGHQYLTDEGIDDAIIKISFNEKSDSPEW